MRDGAGWTPLHEAAGAGQVEGLRALLRGGAAVDAANQDGESVLYLMAKSKGVDKLDSRWRPGV